jgi:ribosomal protein S18 acetylase RimI-like enzyme
MVSARADLPLPVTEGFIWRPAKRIDSAVLGVDSENPTGALKLYEHLGFEVVKRYISFAKTVNTVTNNKRLSQK